MLKQKIITKWENELQNLNEAYQKGNYDFIRRHYDAYRGDFNSIEGIALAYDQLLKGIKKESVKDNKESMSLFLDQCDEMLECFMRDTLIGENEVTGETEEETQKLLESFGFDDGAEFEAYVNYYNSEFDTLEYEIKKVRRLL